LLVNLKKELAVPSAGAVPPLKRKEKRRAATALPKMQIEKEESEIAKKMKNLTC